MIKYKELAKKVHGLVLFPFFLAGDLFSIKVIKRYPFFYYNKVMNVGDFLNVYLVERISGRKPYLVRTPFFSHLLPVGSIMHFSNRRSVVWGSGLIKEEDAQFCSYSKVVALRGMLSKKALSSRDGGLDGVALGDPAVLMPFFYKRPELKKIYRVGVVLHYSERDMDIFKGLVGDGVTFIDVSQVETGFIDKLCQCEYVISSSLHGLILADAYGIPNKWAVFSDRIIGGRFKFMDYYSTTSSPDEMPCIASTREDLEDMVKKIGDTSSVKGFVEDKLKLLDSFPEMLDG